MTIVPVMWAIWGALTLVTAAVYLYRSTLMRDEDDQLFLDDSFNHEKIAQEAIAARVGKLKPVLRLSVWLLGAATVFVVGYYVLDIITQFA